MNPENENSHFADGSGSRAHQGQKKVIDRPAAKRRINCRRPLAQKRTKEGFQRRVSEEFHWYQWSGSFAKRIFAIGLPMWHGVSKKSLLSDHVAWHFRVRESRKIGRKNSSTSECIFEEHAGIFAKQLHINGGQAWKQIKPIPYTIPDQSYQILTCQHFELHHLSVYHTAQHDTTWWVRTCSKIAALWNLLGPSQFFFLPSDLEAFVTCEHRENEGGTREWPSKLWQQGADLQRQPFSFLAQFWATQRKISFRSATFLPCK